MFVKLRRMFCFILIKMNDNTLLMTVYFFLQILFEMLWVDTSETRKNKPCILKTGFLCFGNNIIVISD